MHARSAISLLATGGTISVARSPSHEQGHDGARELEPPPGELPVGIDVYPRDVVRRSSRDVTLDDLWTLAQAVQNEIARGRDGVVVTHGTDTLEETAYALALLVETTVPVVVTGAMRAPHLAGPDGPANVRAALVAAASPNLAAYGPVVVFQDEVHVASLVTKTHSARVAAFTSPAAGPVGFVAEDHLVLLLGPPPTVDLLPHAEAPTKQVGLIPSATNIDGTAAEILAPHFDGLVVAALGAGHVSGSLGGSLASIVGSGRPVVVASRCPDAALLTHTYTGSGSEMDLRRAGLLFANLLTPPKARLRLAFGLSAKTRAEELFPRSPMSRALG